MAFKRPVIGTLQLAEEVQHYVPEESKARIQEIIQSVSTAILLALLEGKQVDFNHFKLFAVASDLEVNGEKKTIPVLKAVLSRSGRETLSHGTDLFKQIRADVKASKEMYRMSKDSSTLELDVDISLEELNLLLEGDIHE